MIETYKFPQMTLSGSNGTAGGTVTSVRPLRGQVNGIYFDHSAGTATTDVVVKTQGPPVKTVLTVSNSITDGWYYPRVQEHNPSGGTVNYDATGTAGVYDKPVVDDYVIVTALQGNNNSTLDVWIELEY